MVKNDGGKVVGCHPTKAKAQAQLAALYANEEASVDRAVDNTAWDGNAAMTTAKTAADYRAICAGHTAGDQSLRGTWKLPHHKRPGAPPNAAGVRAALARFSQTKGLTDPSAARRHLEAHMSTIQAQNESAALPTTDLYRAIYPGVEVREAGEVTPTMVGHFARFGEWALIDSFTEGRFYERIASGSFEDSFASFTPKPLFQHGRDPELGDKILGGPVDVREDDEGAAYEVPLFPSVPPLLLDGLRAGAYGASFRFSVEDEQVDRRPERSEHNPEGLPERTITKARVAEFGPVTFPAYVGATAGIRSLTDTFRTPSLDDEIERLVRESPGELARRIERVLTGQKGDEAKPPEDKSQPVAAGEPVAPRFRTREEFLRWISKS